MRFQVGFASIGILSCAIVAAAAITASSARAGSDICCVVPHVIYALPPGPLLIPMAGNVLYPPDPVPRYVVDQGGRALFGAVVYARPGYWGSGYAFADAYSYDYPCVASYGHGLRSAYRAWRVAATCPPPYRAPRYMDYR
jgi:hypothetical protein